MHSRSGWLDFCRALAITMVVLAHGRYYLWPISGYAHRLVIGGFLGVELFFVLSGFLVGRILVDRFQHSGSAWAWIRVFWVRRWLRTIPNYLLFLVINLLLLWLAIRPAPWPNLPSYLLFLQNLAWPHPAFFAEAWSLSIEEVFYFITPPLLAAAFLVSRKKRSALLAVTVCILIFSLAARVFVVLRFNPPWGEGIRNIVVLRLDAIMIGMLIALAQGDPRWWPRVKALSPLMALLLVPCMIVAASPFEVLDRSFFARTFFFSVMSLGFAGLLVVGLDLRLPEPLRMTSGAVARWSYSAYLTNLPVSSVLTFLWGPATSSAGWFARWLVFMGATLLTSALVYHLFESRILAFRDRRYSGATEMPPERSALAART